MNALLSLALGTSLMLGSFVRSIEVDAYNPYGTAPEALPGVAYRLRLSVDPTNPYSGKRHSIERAQLEAMPSAYQGGKHIRFTVDATNPYRSR